MKAVTKLLAGAIGVAALASAAPAAAQYYPGYPGGDYGYPGGGYGYGNQGGLGAILDAILGGRRYAQPQRHAVEQCVRAVEYRINTRGFDNEGGRYRNYGYGYGYDNAYRNYQGARVLSVTDVDYRSNGRLRIRGLATTGTGYGNPGYGYGYPGYGNPGYGNPGYGYPPYGGGYGYNSQMADARFSCSVDRYGRITDIDATRMRGYPYRR